VMLLSVFTPFHAGIFLSTPWGVCVEMLLARLRGAWKFSRVCGGGKE